MKLLVRASGPMWMCSCSGGVAAERDRARFRGWIARAWGRLGDPEAGCNGPEQPAGRCAAYHRQQPSSSAHPDRTHLVLRATPGGVDDHPQLRLGNAVGSAGGAKRQAPGDGVLPAVVPQLVQRGGGRPQGRRGVGRHQGLHAGEGHCGHHLQAHSHRRAVGALSQECVGGPYLASSCLLPAACCVHWCGESSSGHGCCCSDTFQCFWLLATSTVAMTVACGACCWLARPKRQNAPALVPKQLLHGCAFPPAEHPRFSTTPKYNVQASHLREATGKHSECSRVHDPQPF